MQILEGKQLSKIKLFCLPYAGGSSAIFMDWTRDLDKKIQLIPVELAGRGRRFTEPFYRSIDDAVNDIHLQIASELDGSQIAFFGHSMGSILAYELAYKIKSLNYEAPFHLFFSGSDAPHLKCNEKKRYKLPDEEFLHEINELEGTPKEFFEQKELVDIFLPVLRNDFMIIEQYVYREKPIKLNSDISVLYGKDEEIKGDIKEWKIHTQKSCNVHEFEGGHFFINEQRKKVIELINHTLESKI